MAIYDPYVKLVVGVLFMPGGGVFPITGAANRFLRAGKRRKKHKKIVDLTGDIKQMPVRRFLRQ